MTDDATDAKRPDGIGREIEERSSQHHHASTLSLIVLGALVAWGASGFAGSRNEDFAVDAAALALHVSTPTRARNGEIYETRVSVAARERIGKLVVGISPALWRDSTVNSLVPAPAEESHEDDLFRFTYGPVEAGQTFEAKFDLQINPTRIGSERGVVAVFDGNRKLADLPLQLRVLP
ncbi:hypothetical protein [Piscinibacter koreensis]|uniref:Uncharacterized protein n=1 Tax=Piscinibacter koreensis TaxID=2742824 RepID=A0A7Y6NME8_9BURK|nr:hypothetical protein [Schlegelella koreensis]NUZ05801.1 hypothetical protein [Schlegelella koreensis]